MGIRLTKIQKAYANSLTIRKGLTCIWENEVNMSKYGSFLQRTLAEAMTDGQIIAQVQKLLECDDLTAEEKADLEKIIH